MQSRRDQVQAYFYVVGRLVSALMRGRPDDQTTPTRRFAMGAVVGTLIGGLVVLGFGIYGILRPGGNTAWQQPGSIIVEQETGARYVNINGVLRPALNYTSAKLAAGENATPQTLSQASLAAAPRGTPIGIPQAPDSLPTALSQAPWMVCAATQTDPSGREEPITDLKVGAEQGTPVPDNEGILVSTPDSTKYLIWQGKRLKLSGQSALNALDYASKTPFPVTSTWLNTLQPGPDLTAPKISNIGSPAQTISGQPGKVGQIFQVSNPVSGSHVYWMMHEDGVAPLNQTTAMLMLADPQVAAANGGSTPTQLSLAAVNSAPQSKQADSQQGFPPVPPRIHSVETGGSSRACASFTVGAKSSMRMVTVPRAATDPGGPSSGSAPAERIAIAPGTGVLAGETPAQGGVVGTQYLVNDLGVKYPLATPDVAKKLGYPAPTPVPKPLLDLLPKGPSLDPGQATTTRPPGSTSAASTKPAD